MEKFNLQEKVDEILNQLRQYGASPKNLKIIVLLDLEI